MLGRAAVKEGVGGFMVEALQRLFRGFLMTNTTKYSLEEKVVERESNCYLPWGLGLGSVRSQWCVDALSLDNTMRRMPDDRTMSKTELIEHITNLGCAVSCTYIAYNPM